MKSSRFKHDYSKNASKLHKQVGDILRTSLFKHHKIYQEYPVNKINVDFHSGREKFDWYIKDLNLIIEVHGQQHYGPVCFGGVSQNEADANFRRQQYRDMIKRDAVEAVGATYIIVKYDEKINEEMLVDRIFKNASNKEEIAKVIVVEEDLDEKVAVATQTGRERRRKEMEAKALASERRKAYRENYKKSDAYAQQKERAKAARKANYQKAKEFKKNLKRGA